jgi:hypothetical protein
MVLGLGACKLVDQTTFGAAPAAPAPDQLTAALTGVPLVVIRGPYPAMYDEALRDAVGLAEARKPNAAYDVVTIVPASGSSDQQIAEAAKGQPDAIDMMDKLAEIGVDPQRMHLSVRADAAVAAREMRLYVH